MTSHPKTIKAIELITERFVLRPIEPVAFARRTLHWTSDRQALSDMAWKPDGWTMWRWWRHLRKLARKHRMGHGIWPKGATEPIGMHVVAYQPSTGNITFGVLIADHGWRGKGAVVEVREAILGDCFERLGVHRATGWVNARNFGSLYNYQRLGFRRESTMRESFVLLDGSLVDQLGFGLLRSEWFDRRRMLKSPQREGNA